MIAIREICGRIYHKDFNELRQNWTGTEKRLPTSFGRIKPRNPEIVQKTWRLEDEDLNEFSEKHHGSTEDIESNYAV